MKLQFPPPQARKTPDQRTRLGQNSERETVMPALNIPEQYAAGLSLIIHLPLDRGNAIAAALARAKTTRTRELVELVVTHVPDLPVKDARDIVDTLRSLYQVRTSMDLPIDTFIGDILKAAKQTLPDGMPNDSNEVLHALLGVQPLSMISKARGLHTDHKNIFCSARVLTDLRPVFDANIDDTPTGFVMAHILKLGYHVDGDHTELYVAMDKSDLASLIEILQRAQKKAASLHKFGESDHFNILAD